MVVSRYDDDERGEARHIVVQAHQNFAYCARVGDGKLLLAASRHAARAIVIK